MIFTCQALYNLSQCFSYYEKITLSQDEYGIVATGDSIRVRLDTETDTWKRF